MTCRAVISRRIVTNGLTLGDISVMTICTSVSIWTGVDKRCTSKGRGVMARVAIQEGIGRHVVWEFTDASHIVMAGVTTTHKRWAGMCKGARAKSTWGMASTAILNGRHMFV